MTRKTRWLASLSVLACFGVLSYAQVPDGGLKVKGPGGSQEMTSPAQVLGVTQCISPLPADCKVFGADVPQAVVAFYNQTGVAFGNFDLNLQFTSANYGQSVGCVIGDIEPVFTTASCSPNPIPIPSSGPNAGDVTIQFTKGIGVSCYNAGAEGDDTDTSHNGACLINSVVNSIFGGPWINPFNPTNVQTSGPCTLGEFTPPGLVCGPNSVVIGLGFTGDKEGFILTDNMLDVTAEGIGNAPEPPTLLLVGAALFGMSFLLLKKKAVVA